MRLVSFHHENRASFGLLIDGGVVDIGRRLGACARLHDWLRRTGGEPPLGEYARLPPDLPLADIVLDKPLTDFGKCFCVGVNYPDRKDNYRDGGEAPGYPSLFTRFSESFVAPGQPLVRPHESRELDYEGEVVMVIGKPGRRIAAANWADHVFGWTLGNEGTDPRLGAARHVQRDAGQELGLVRRARARPSSPATRRATGPFELVTRVNREERQRDSTARLVFPVRPHRRICLDLLHVGAGRRDLYRHAGRRRRAARSAALAGARRHGGDRSVGAGQARQRRQGRMNDKLRPFSRSLPMALMRARETVLRHFRPKLQAAHLTEPQWRTLRALQDGEEMEATRLACVTFLLAPSLTRILRDLEARGLVMRRAGPRDARVALISLSPQGALLLRDLGAHSERIYAAIEARLGRERLNGLMHELSAVAKRFANAVGSSDAPACVEHARRRA